jgi:acetyltransferase-like isoleucine patch superfamily enzyme
MKMLSRSLRVIMVRIKKMFHYAVQNPRIWKYKLLSTAKHVQGKAWFHQPVLFLGLGRIIIGKNVNLGYRASPYLYSGYIHIEARQSNAIISIGDNCWLNNNCTLISEGGGIVIGEGSLLGTNVEIYDSDFHELAPAKRIRGGNPCIAPVSIGENVFIGSNVRVLKGVSIGDKSVIANGSVVIHSVPPNVIVGGNPARVLKQLQDNQS